MNNTPLAHDLALKRTVHAPIELKPIYAWRDVILAVEINLPPIVLLFPHGEERFDMAEVADTLGKALTNVLISQGEKDIFTEKNRAWVAQICRELGGNLTEMSRKQNPLRLTLNSLYELIEKTLVDNNAYMVAKSLLLNRSRKLSVSRESAAQSAVRVIRRNSQVVPWNDHKVEIAVRKTFLSLARDSAPAVAISKAVSERVNASNQAFVRIEEVQDMVQEELMKAGHYKVAEAYILFRAERAAARDRGETETPAAATESTASGQETLVVVKKSNGETVLWEGADLRKRIEFAMTGLDLCLSSDEIEVELRRAVYDQISQKDLDATIILNSKTLIERDADFAKFAGRIQLTYIYEEVLGWDIMRDGIAKLKECHQKAFRKYVEHGIAIKRLNPRLLDFDLARLGGALDPSSDLEFDFLGVQTLYDRYLIVDKVSKPSHRIETPQFFWMRVAMGLFLDEKGDRESKAIGLYDLYKTRRFCSSTPTLFNSGTLHSQLSSCFPGDTPVVTSTGMRNIEDIREGDHVLAQDGSFRRVLGTRAKANQKRLVEVALSAMLGGRAWIRPTEDHLLFAIPARAAACVRQRASGGMSACVEYRGKREQCFTVKSHYAAACERLLESDVIEHATWIRAGELRDGDFVEMLFHRVEKAAVLKPVEYLGSGSWIETDGLLYEAHHDEKRYEVRTAKNQVKAIRSSVPINGNFLRLVGYYLSEGHCQGSDSLFFTFGRTEVEFISDTVDLCERVFGITPSLKKGSGDCTCVVLHSKLAVAFMLALFGTGFDRKKLPQCVLEAPNDALEELLVGVFRGDACAVHRTQLSLQLSNRDLILQLFQVALKIGILPIVQKPSMSALARVQPYVLTITPSDAPRLAFKVRKGIDLFDFQGEDSKWKNRRFFVEGRAFYRVDDVTLSEYSGDVHDIQVEGDPSFSAAGVCAHNCYLYYVDDSIEGIFQRGIAENAYLSKWAGGLGGSWTAVRGTGAYIGGTNGESQGVIPFLKLHNDQLVAVNQGGKRKGSGCAYLESWHNDIFEFLELRKNTGDDRRRTHDMNTANWIPDLFMKRMEARAPWTLFRANEVPDLHDAFGRKFEELYVNYEKMAEEGKIHGHKVEALDLWKKMLSMIFETGHPWITFKDPCNVRSPQDHVGVVHSSNLCCITADQRVVTSEGLVTVGYLFEKARRLALVGGTGNTPLTQEAVNTVLGRSGPVSAGPMLLPRPDAPIVRIWTKEGYTHKVTPDHKVWVVDQGWVEAQDLKRGDLIEIQQAEGLWGTEDSVDLALVAGLVAGDGTFMHHSGDSVSACIDIWANEFSLIDEVESAVARILDQAGEHAVTTFSLEPKFKGDEYKKRLCSAPLARVLGAVGFDAESKLKVPEFVWKGTRETAAAYLRGLYAADATVESSGEVTTCALASVSRDFLAGVQVLLANFGVKSSLTRMRSGGLAELPDGMGGTREYYQNELWRLHVSSIRGCRIMENLTGIGRLRGNARFLSNLEKPGYVQKMHATFDALEQLPNENAFCLQVFTDEHSWTVNGLITKNTEITLNTSKDETAVCNLGSVILETHLLPDGSLDHRKLRETIRMAVRALDNVIDINFYPTEAAQRSNKRHRPIGLGMMGLANTLYMKGVAFASIEAVEFNDEAMEAIAFYAYEASSDLAAERGAYSSYKGSKWDRGLLPPDTVDLLEKERGLPIQVPRTSRMNWEPLRAKIAAQGMRNSNVLAIAPTATISNITNTSPCIEPTYKNLFVKSNLSGEFIVLNPFLVKDLKARGLWDQDMMDSLKYFDGELADIERIPADLKQKYLTAFDIDHKWVVDAAARRQKWIDQSQSVNLWIKTPDLKTLSHMYRHAWHTGLKTTYYLRGLGASNIEKATVQVKKEMRGAAGETKAETATRDAATLSTPPFAGGDSSPKQYTAEEKTACSIEAMRNGGTCEACQ